MSMLLMTKKKSKLHTEWDQSEIEIPLITRNHAMVTLNQNQPMGSAWFVNGKIRYKRQGKAIVRELRSWNDL